MLDSGVRQAPAAADDRSAARPPSAVTAPLPGDVACFRVAPDHPCLAGHFPGRPLVPAVLILDHVATALRRGHGLRLVRIVDARFNAPLRPGESASIRLDAPDSGAVWRFEVHRGEALLVRGRLEVAP
jgi:3-hydroxyacyl-[acyl-carrier-protein] dehydratase